MQGIREVVAYLRHKDKAIQSDCIKVLYEIGYLKHALIAEYVADFIGLLTHTNNRLVWGAMIALSTIATIRAREIFDARERVMQSLESGSVITVDAGIKTLAGVAAAEVSFNTVLFPYLLNQLRLCRPKSVAQYAESIFVAVTEQNVHQYREVLAARKEDLQPAQLKRIEKLERRLP
ncbi:hypothetical protein JXQ70_12820 [bacterium]|nr:hypothetical protein [bacterium]